MPHAPIRVITVEREYGSRGGEFAHDLAKHLGWRLLDADLPCSAARAAGVSAELAKKYDRCPLYHVTRIKPRGGP